MKTSQKGIDLICEFEGCFLKAYKCPAGVWTIGYGHIEGVKPGDTLASKQEAMELLREDLPRYERPVEDNCAVNLTQSQFDALVSFCYNVGAGALKKSTLLRKLNNADFEGAAEQFLVWTKGGGRTLPGLVRRRKAEKKMFEGN